eukprot:TRINITY_DN16121_c0_g1_i1.p1 TRINITY_DN16121_c0_g1~~TRINITY_DN16121_c0_g1_i1.p1  ORF type:complete len:118 (-),score=6.82 TRINITY_DN16121_c0_g1_i1:541-894(-)
MYLIIYKKVQTISILLIIVQSYHSWGRCDGSNVIIRCFRFDNRLHISFTITGGILNRFKGADNPGGNDSLLFFSVSVCFAGCFSEAFSAVSPGTLAGFSMHSWSAFSTTFSFLPLVS